MTERPDTPKPDQPNPQTDGPRAADPSTTPTTDSPPHTPASDTPTADALPGMPDISMLPEEETNPNDNLVGTTISGKYKVTDTIGQGGMGVVVKAIDIHLQREVTIKRLNDMALRSRTGIDRFFREARSVAALNHRNIVSIYELGSDEQGPYIVMEYLPGGDLEKKIASQEKFSLEQTLAVLKPVAKGLAYAHSKGIVHRDIKPSNIILDEDGTPKIVDFGIARRDDHLDLSLTGQGIGTPAYMAPEQRTDSKRVDHRSDIFALAKTAYQMITGELPDTVYFDELDTDVRPAFERALQRDPDKRQASMDEFIAEIDVLAPATLEGTNTPGTTSSATICPNCDAHNKMDAAFCHNCGAGMFEECPSCSVENRVGAKFCLACGISIEKYHAAEEALRKARGYLEQADYDEATSWAKTGMETSYLQAEFEEIETDAAERKTRIARLKSRVDQTFKSKQYREAATAVDEALKIAPASRELRLAKSRIQNALHRTEIEAAEKATQQALDQKRYPEAAKAWTRLVQIDTEHPSAPKLRAAIKAQEEDHRRRYQEAAADRKAGRMAAAITGIRSLKKDYAWDRNINIDAEAWEALEAKLAPHREEAKRLEADDKPKLAIASWNQALTILRNDAESLEGLQRATDARQEQKARQGKRNRRNLLVAATLLIIGAGVPAGLYVYEQTIDQQVDDAIAIARQSEGPTVGLNTLDNARAISDHPLSLVPAWREQRTLRLNQATYDLLLASAAAQLQNENLTAAETTLRDSLAFADNHALTNTANPPEDTANTLIERAIQLAAEQRYDDGQNVLLLAANLLGPDAVAGIETQILAAAEARRTALMARQNYNQTRDQIDDPEGFLPFTSAGREAQSLIDAAQQNIDKATAPQTPLPQRATSYANAEQNYLSALEALKDARSQVAQAIEQRATTTDAVTRATRLWTDQQPTSPVAPALTATANQLQTAAQQAIHPDTRNYTQAISFAQHLENLSRAITLIQEQAQTATTTQTRLNQRIQRTVENLNQTYNETGDFLADFAGPTWRLAREQRTQANNTYEEAGQRLAAIESNIPEPTDSNFENWINELPEQVLAYEQLTEQAIAGWLAVDSALDLAANEAAITRLAAGKRNTTGMTFIAVQGGPVVMGHATRRSDPSLGIGPEELRRSGTVDQPLLISRFEVTRGQYAEYIRDRLIDQGLTGPDADQAIADAPPWKNPTEIATDGRTFTQNDNHPVVFVSAKDAADFCRWLSEREGITYRLPTEAEWEYVARADAPADAPFHWGDRVTGLSPVNGIPTGDGPARYQWEEEDGHTFTAEVGTGVEPFPANDWGLYNIHGNVAEWATADDGQPIVKGGSWACSVLDSRLGDRRTPAPTSRLEQLGFRIVAELPLGADLPDNLWRDAP
ncbi:protein kinase domain-containing protein [Mucisphaera sp.]|uniref:protein kinase domain-containing protein n=1 Tax=Mucisphaera sp. TaxID=2913024 RepID=UPI003D0D47ED